MITKEYMQCFQLPETKMGALKLTELTDTILWKKRLCFFSSSVSFSAS